MFYFMVFISKPRKSTYDASVLDIGNYILEIKPDAIVLVHDFQRSSDKKEYAFPGEECREKKQTVVDSKVRILPWTYVLCNVTMQVFSLRDGFYFPIS